jgi:hypothetical protein
VQEIFNSIKKKILLWICKKKYCCGFFILSQLCMTSAIILQQAPQNKHHKNDCLMIQWILQLTLLRRHLFASQNICSCKLNNSSYLLIEWSHQYCSVKWRVAYIPFSEVLSVDQPCVVSTWEQKLVRTYALETGYMHSFFYINWTPHKLILS